ncbi:MAG: tetratricopeptide (TPR) repeat protein, partial [Myxococcota bacterium]
DQAVAQFDQVDWIPVFDQHPDGFVALAAYAQLLGQCEGRHEKAAELWGEVATRTAEPDKALVNRAIMVGRGRGTAAEVEVLEEVTGAYPDSAFAWHTLGIGLRHLDRFEDALAATDRAIALSPEHRDAWWNRGSVLCLLGREEEAVDAAVRCLEIDPTVAAALCGDDDFDVVRKHPRFLALMA